MTNPPRARERSSPGAGYSAAAAGVVTPVVAEPKVENMQVELPVKRNHSGGDLVAMSWYERMGHAAIFPGGDDDVERIDT